MVSTTIHSPRSGAPQGAGPRVLISLVPATYFGNVSSIAMTPFLLDIARDLEADLAAVGVLLAASSVTWGIVSIFAGVASDRFGRRPVLFAGLFGLAVAPIWLASSSSFPPAFVARIIGGFGGGAFMGTAFAAASDLFPSAERGRALGWMITGQSISLVLGVPLAAYAGSFLGWRGALAIQGVAVVISAVLVWLVVPVQPPRAHADAAPRPSVMSLLTPRVLSLLGANTMERFCYGGVAVYLATFLTISYGISLEVLAVGLGLVALGNLVGNFIGGELSDRLPSRTALAAVSLAVTGLLALPLLIWLPGLWVSVLLGFAYTVVNALGRPSLVAAVSEVSNEARGALLGVNMTFASIGWLGSQAVGGWIITTMGFPMFGWLTAACGVVGAILAVAARLPGRAERAAAA